MPYLVKEGDPAPWFTGTINSLGGLADMAMRDADAARRERLAIQADQRAAAEQRARMAEDQQFRREMDAANFGQQKELAALYDQYLGKRQAADDARRMTAEEARLAAKNAQDQTDAQSLQGFAEASGLLPAQANMPEGVAGPGPRLPALNRPEDVRTVITAQGQQQARAATQADREADNLRLQTAQDQRAEYQRQQLEIARQRAEAYLQSVLAKGTPPSEEDILGFADAIQASNPGIPASQALGISRGRLQYKGPMQIPTETLAQKGEAKILDGQIGTLRSLRQSLLGSNARSIAKKLGADMGIPEIPDPTIKDMSNPDMVKIFDALDGQIGDLEAKRRTMGTAAPSSRGSAPASPAQDDPFLRDLGP